jgi:hypothetical protein
MCSDDSWYIDGNGSAGNMQSGFPDELPPGDFRRFFS